MLMTISVRLHAQPRSAPAGTRSPDAETPAANRIDALRESFFTRGGVAPAIAAAHDEPAWELADWLPTECPNIFDIHDVIGSGGASANPTLEPGNEAGDPTDPRSDFSKPADEQE